MVMIQSHGSLDFAFFDLGRVGLQFLVDDRLGHLQRLLERLLELAGCGGYPDTREAGRVEEDLYFPWAGECLDLYLVGRVDCCSHGWDRDR